MAWFFAFLFLGSVLVNLYQLCERERLIDSVDQLNHELEGRADFG
jgi:hypothetical protein